MPISSKSAKISRRQNNPIYGILTSQNWADFQLIAVYGPVIYIYFLFRLLKIIKIHKREKAFHCMNETSVFIPRPVMSGNYFRYNLDTRIIAKTGIP